MASIVHVIPVAAVGGGARAVRNAVRSPELAAYDHELISLRPADESARPAFAEAGVPLVEGAGIELARARIEAADIVHLHYWNSPELFELLRGPWPPCRLVIWSAVGGGSDPQFMSRELVDFADRCVAASAFTGELEHLRGMSVSLIEPLTGPERMGSLRPSPPGERRGEVAVGYLGTVDPLKMHPEFTALSLAVEHPGARFIVRGAGDGLAGLRREAEAAGAPERFDIAGYVPDPAALFAELDIFGYPLCADNYSSLELVLQEAMFAGVPPVVLPYGGAARTVTDGVTGIVATDEAGYSKAVGHLCADPELRARLGAQARSHAEARWSQAISGAAWDGLYRELLELPKRPRGWPEPPPETGAQAFIAALGPTADVFAASLAGDPAADEAIAASSPVLGWADGGVLDYRRRYPTDPHLHLWAGLVLAARGRRALAAGEFAAAKRAGLDPERVEGSLAELVGPAGQ